LRAKYSSSIIAADFLKIGLVRELELTGAATFGSALTAFA
jgi:hypothetical protein